MHTALQRLSAVGSFAIPCLVYALVAVALSSLFLTPVPPHSDLVLNSARM